MQSIFDQNTRLEIIRRINALTAYNTAQWGKMTVSQMIKHCALCEEYYYGNIKIRRSFAGRLFGRNAIRAILKDESTGLQKNAPTSPLFRVDSIDLDFDKEQANWAHLIERYSKFDRESFTHWFFGKMTKKQLGEFIYKHCDHHLRQFGV
jgi:hypothetical protein